MCTCKVGCIFVGETEQRPLAPKNDYWRFRALRHKVGKINPRAQFHHLLQSANGQSIGTWQKSWSSDSPTSNLIREAPWSSGEHRGFTVCAMVLGREINSQVCLKTRWIRRTTWWQKRPSNRILNFRHRSKKNLCVSSQSLAHFLKAKITTNYLR